MRFFAYAYFALVYLAVAAWVYTVIHFAIKYW